MHYLSDCGSPHENTHRINPDSMITDLSFAIMAGRGGGTSQLMQLQFLFNFVLFPDILKSLCSIWHYNRKERNWQQIGAKINENLAWYDTIKKLTHGQQSLSTQIWEFWYIYLLYSPNFSVLCAVNCSMFTAYFLTQPAILFDTK